jgi:putative sigma-54 modulation protein
VTVRIEVRGRRTELSEDLDRHVRRRFRAVSRQVSGLATLEVELSEEQNPAIADRCIAEATLRLKGATLRAKEESPDMRRSIHLVADELGRQVKRHREKRRMRRAGRRLAARLRGGGRSLEAQ